MQGKRTVVAPSTMTSVLEKQRNRLSSWKRPTGSPPPGRVMALQCSLIPDDHEASSATSPKVSHSSASADACHRLQAVSSTSFHGTPPKQLRRQSRLPLAVGRPPSRMRAAEAKLRHSHDRCRRKERPPDLGAAGVGGARGGVCRGAGGGGSGVVPMKRLLVGRSLDLERRCCCCCCGSPVRYQACVVSRGGSWCESADKVVR